MKHVKSLLSLIIKPIFGKSIFEVLFETSIFCHLAIYRLLTNAVEILNMLSAVIIFVEILNNFKQAKKITEIKTHLKVSVEEIVQYQNLFERKLTDQCKNIAL